MPSAAPLRDGAALSSPPGSETAQQRSQATLMAIRNERPSGMRIMRFATSPGMANNAMVDKQNTATSNDPRITNAPFDLCRPMTNSTPARATRCERRNYECYSKSFGLNLSDRC